MLRSFWPARLAIITFVLLMLVAAVCQAQGTNATVTGEITESTGAVLPGASITLTNANTGIVTKSVANDRGLYRIPGLEPGVYKAEVTKDGFKSELKDGIELHTEDVVSIDFKMQVGAVAESVTIEAGAPLIETQSTSIGTTVEGRQVQEAPLNGRNPMNLVALTPGVVAEGTSQGSPASNQGSNNTQLQGFGNYQIGGGLAGWNATFVDGANENTGGGPNISIIPTQDSVGEFHVDTSAVTPQYGGFAGGVVNFSTKSGGNQIHGSVYEYNRNTVLDSNTWWGDRLKQPIPVLNQNQFGATVGGPIIKNKTFFFFSWEQTRLLTAAAQEFRVPTPAEMTGDFTADYGTTTDGMQDFGNYTVANGQNVYSPAAPENCPGGGINKICPQHISQAATQMYAAHYFTPVATGSQLSILQASGYNTQLIGHQPNNEIQYVGRIDHQLSQNQKLFLRYTYWNTYIPNPAITKMPAIPTQPTTFTSQQYVFGDNYTISPTLNADIRLSYNRWFFNQQSNGNGNYNLAQFGPAWAALATQIPYKSPIQLTQNNWANEPFSINLTTLDRFNNYAASVNMTKVVGHHSIVFGGEARRIETYDFTDGATAGAFNFPGSSSFPNTGISEFVTGISFNTGALGMKVNPDSYSYYQGYYVSDTWQATPKLTVNAGIRWELPGAWYEKHDHNSVLLANAANPLGSFMNPVPSGPTTLKGEIVEVDSSAYRSSSQSEIHYHLFDPRLGVSYSIDPKTVVRAGYGMMHPCIACGSTTPDSSILNSASTAGPNPGGYWSMDAAYPGTLLRPLQRSTQLMAPYSQFSQTLIGTAISGEEPYQTYQYVQQWNLNLERSLGSSIAMLLSYVGSSGTHLGAASRNYDALPDQDLSLGSTLLTKVANPFQGIAQPGKIGGATANYGQFLLPYPEFTGVTSSGLYYGQSSYNALIATFRKRFKAGATVEAAYTWAHFITNVESASSGNDATGTAGPQDYNNPAADRSNSSADIPQTLSVNYIIDLPFGKGKFLLNNANGIVDHIVSGWTWSGITTYQMGFPLDFTVLNGTTLSQNFATGNIRPNVVAGVSKKTQGSRWNRINSTWFNITAFSNPGPWAYGNESRVDSTLRSDGIKNWDMNLAKNTAIREGISLQFRAEYFNIFNHPQYGVPVTTLGASNFGVITANQGNGATNLNQPRIGQLSLRLNF